MSASYASFLARQSACLRNVSARFPRANQLLIPCAQIRNDARYVGAQKWHLSGETKIPVYQTQGAWLPWKMTGSLRHYSTSGTEQTEGTDIEEPADFHSIIKDTERSKGPADKMEFQAETRKLLDIVARSLYSEKEVFIRELISNASDALEKLRYMQMKGEAVLEGDTQLEIHIATDDNKKTFTIQDTGVGMSKDEMVENLGTIARSGSKAFLESVGEKGSSDINSNIIGQFGVGFYSSFMVGEKVDVYSMSFEPTAKAYKWTSDGTGSYEIAEAEGVQRGTKIVIHLKGDCYDYCKEETIKEVIKKYSNFVGVPIFLNGQRANIVQALWLMDPKDVTEEMHDEFFRFVGGTYTYDTPRFHLHYKADAPLNIRALFYIPEHKPTLFDMSRETDVSLQLYSKKVMIMSKANHILPRWMRFVKGVVDSEDIPLNLSRELLQDSSLIRKLRQVLTGRLLKFMMDQSKKDPEKYLKFFDDYGMFFREGIVSTPDQSEREDIAKLMRFESSACEAGQRISLDDYCERMKAGAREIYYLTAPSRELAETSPYMEAIKKRDLEVLYLYEAYDELVLMNLGQYDRKFLKSVENELSGDKQDSNTVDENDPESIKQSEADTLTHWLKSTLQSKVEKVKITKRLSSHPCIITVAEMGSARHFLRTTLADRSLEEKMKVLQPTLEINPSHPLIKSLQELQTTDPYLGKLLAEQLYDNAMVNAGLMDDTRSMVSRINLLLERALAKK